MLGVAKPVGLVLRENRFSNVAPVIPVGLILAGTTPDVPEARGLKSWGSPEVRSLAGFSSSTLSPFPIASENGSLSEKLISSETSSCDLGLGL